MGSKQEKSGISFRLSNSYLTHMNVIYFEKATKIWLNLKILLEITKENYL